MKNKKGQSQKEYRENHNSKMKKKIGEEMIHNLDLNLGGSIIQVIANDLRNSEGTRHFLKKGHKCRT